MAYCIVTVKYKRLARAPSIFRTSRFGRWVVTHSLTDSDFHGHRPAINNDQHHLQYHMTKTICLFILTFCASNSASSAYQKWPTWHSHSLFILNEVEKWTSLLSYHEREVHRKKGVGILHPVFSRQEPQLVKRRIRKDHLCLKDTPPIARNARGPPILGPCPPSVFH